MWHWTMQSSRPFLVFDIGGTKCACAVWTPDGELWGRARLTRKRLPGQKQSQLVSSDLGRRVLAKMVHERPDLSPPTRAGVASAGQIDVGTGTVSYATFHLPGWIGFPLGAAIGRWTGDAGDDRQ